MAEKFRQKTFSSASTNAEILEVVVVSALRTSLLQQFKCAKRITKKRSIICLEKEGFLFLVIISKYYQTIANLTFFASLKQIINDCHVWGYFFYQKNPYFGKECKCINLACIQ